ncbi:MAG: N-acetylglucosamine kinase [Bacteroidales bacterium]|nr:N-acetylglucosamine kinase [Bacteroidales bacterium]
MILIADSGASKTEWACVSKDGRTRIGFFTQGYNPNYITGPQIVEDIKSSLPEGFPVDEVSEIYFYGAGVTPLQYPFMEETLLKVFTKAGTVFIAMDTLASCRALLQTEPGFAAILGTGANSCLYDGCNEGLNVDSCGFILGDEGSGANLGKRMITDYIRRNMPPKVYELVGKELGHNNDELLDIIYTKPFPNRFCAQYAKFIAANLDFDPYFPDLVTDAFRQFFKLIVTHYPDYQTYTFNAVGSVAYYFRPLLQKVVEEFGMRMGNILQAPMEGLIKYHLNNG